MSQKKNVRPAPRRAVPSNKSARPTSDVNWDDVLSNLSSGSSGPFFFPKGTRTRLRLVCLEEDKRQFYSQATTVWKGRQKTKFVVFSQVLASEGGKKDSLSDQWKDKIVPVVITKTALQGIISLLAEGYDLFDDRTGYGVVIHRSGSGTDTDYNVLPSPHPVPVDMDAVELPEKSLIEYAEELTNRSLSRSDNNLSVHDDEQGDW